jgi:hypothetical protein
MDNDLKFNETLTLLQSLYNYFTINHTPIFFNARLEDSKQLLFQQSLKWTHKENVYDFSGH